MSRFSFSKLTTEKAKRWKELNSVHSGYLSVEQQGEKGEIEEGARELYEEMGRVEEEARRHAGRIWSEEVTRLRLELREAEERLEEVGREANKMNKRRTKLFRCYGAILTEGREGGE